MHGLKNLPDGNDLRKATLAFIIDREKGKLLLAMKKRGFGAGLWNGYGGKQKPHESIEDAAKRETKEEIGIVAKKLERVGTLNFYFENAPDDKDWNQQVALFVIMEWGGAPSESDEMKPEWFSTSDLPFNAMWEDDRHWLPKIISGKRIEGTFIFGGDQKLKEYEVRELD